MKAIIIGSGLAGPFLALALEQQGISCKIFELRDQSAFEGGFVALAPNALRALSRVGVYDRISAQGWNYEEFQFLSSRNLSRIGTVLNGSQDKYGYKALRISRGIVRQTLLEVLHEREIDIEYNSKCVSIQETPSSKVVATFADGRSEEADFLIGCDGIHSRVRNYLDPTIVPTFSGQMGVGGSLARSKLASAGKDVHMPCMIFGKLNSFAFMPCDYNGDRVGCFATLESQDRSREEWAALQEDKAALLQSMRSYHNKEKWPQLVHEATQNVEESTLSLWPFFKVPELQSWTSQSGRVLVIGDAAHAMPPTGGQGAAMAFEDAITLADVLGQINTKESSHLKSLLGNWQATRQSRVKKVLAFTSKSGDLRKSKPSTLQQILKEWAMWAYFLYIGKDAGLSWIFEYDTTK
ncbi:hypothetical protein B0A52_02221 [Exophiala mesophila]|uniref:FAD-binding domain-containing protein n=1 Tax=Exophiala mesophila TaxID=212818 RepID=A0A438NBE1_EXOME|nr:hypothetical protein B0A52_02221 [Exophiala mesophila]